MHTQAFDYASALLTSQGHDQNTVHVLLGALKAAGFTLASGGTNEFVVRWVNVIERAVPPEADTIIRTITRTSGDGTQSSTTHWLDGLRGPAL